MLQSQPTLITQPKPSPELQLKLNPELKQIPNRQDYIHVIPVIPDIHILPKEPLNRNGLIDRGLQILTEINYLLKINQATGVIFTGDITDRGFKNTDIHYESQVISKIADISNTVNGNCFSVFGNHELTYAKNNLFYSFASIDSDIISNQLTTDVPHNIYPFIKTPNCIDFGDLKIHLLHYQRDTKNYKVLTSMTPINIGIYHDDLVSFESKEELYHHKLGQGISMTNTDIFENVNWAILGHIHTPLNTMNLQNVRYTTIDTPGSLIARTIAEKHTKVNIPVICVNQNGLTRNYIEFNIGDFDETVNKAVTKKQQQQREMSKIFKKTSQQNKAWVDYDNFLASIQDSQVRAFIANSDKELILKSTQMKDEFLKGEH